MSFNHFSRGQNLVPVPGHRCVVSRRNDSVPEKSITCRSNLKGWGVHPTKDESDGQFGSIITCNFYFTVIFHKNSTEMPRSQALHLHQM